MSLLPSPPPPSLCLTTAPIPAPPPATGHFHHYFDYRTYRPTHTRTHPSAHFFTTFTSSTPSSALPQSSHPLSRSTTLTLPSNRLQLKTARRLFRFPLFLPYLFTLYLANGSFIQVRNIISFARTRRESKGILRRYQVANSK